MDAKITRTRVIIPQRRPDQLSRPRVLKRLFDLSQHKLIIVVAPPGYGKTSLLIDFAGKIDRSVSWYAIDSLDKNPSRFFSHLVASITQVHPGFGSDCRLAQQEQLANNGTLLDLVPTIVNELYDHVAENFTLVLDDFHLVQENEEIQAFLNAFIQQVEDSCQIVLASRRLIRLPDLPLMVARSLVGGISMEDLCFQTDEIQALIAQNFDEAIDEDAALELIDKTEGWITGLLLSTQLSQQSGLGSGSLRHSSLQRATGVDLYDYLAHQVLLQQDPEIQEFLLRTSLLDEFNEAFCQQIFVPHVYPAETDWQSMLDAVVANNLFILPVGDGKPWFRYHNLFREFLSRRVHNERPQEANQILEQLAEHYIKEQAWEQAYQVRTQQGNVDILADMIEQAGPLLVHECQLPLLTNWFDSLPDHVFGTRPMLQAARGYTYAVDGKVDDGFRMLQWATEHFAKDDTNPNYIIALMWRSLVQRKKGNFDAALSDADAALDRLEIFHTTTFSETDDTDQNNFSLLLSGNVNEPADIYRIIKAEILHSKGVIYFLMGQTQDGVSYLESAVELYDALANIPRGAVAWMDLATANMNLGRYVQARSQFHKALTQISAHSRQRPRIHILNNLSDLYRLSGNYVKAYSLLQQAIDLAKQVDDVYFQSLCLTSLSELLLDVMDIEAVQACHKSVLLLIEEENFPFIRLHIELALARSACISKDWSTAFNSLDRAGQSILANREQPEWHLYRIAMGQFHLDREKHHQAVNMLSEGLSDLVEDGMPLEEAQIRLLLAGAYFRLGDSLLASEQISKAAKIVHSMHIWQPLVVKGRMVVDILEAIVYSQDSTYSEEAIRFSSDLLGRINHFEEQLDTIRDEIIALRNEPNDNDTAETSQSDLSIRTLGRIEILYRGRPVQNWQGKSHIARDLFFCLLAHKGGLTKDEIGIHFWPDAAPAELKVRFKNAIYRVRKAIAADVLVFDNDLYRLNPDLEIYCDAIAFEDAIAEARAATVALHEKEAYQRAISLYTGDYLLELEAMWAWLERERLAQLYKDASLRLAEVHLDYGEASESLQLCQRLIADDPCLEEAHRMIMQVHAANGNRVALVRQYEICEQALNDEFGAQPSEQTRELFISLTS